MKDVLEQIKAFWASMPSTRRWIVIASVAATLAITGAGVWLGSRPDLVALYPGLSDEDTASVLSWLRSRGVTHELEKRGDGKTAVMVPKERVGEIRIDLAAEGIPAAGAAEGWSILDKQPFGTSDFQQHVNKIRALQGELAKTIGAIKGVAGARVHLAVPERGTLRLQREAPSASVMVRLRPGATLSKSQVKGIVNLVAQSVPGLTPDTVSVIDDGGTPLYTPKKEQDQEPEGAEDQQRRMAREMEKNVLRLLESVVGPGNVVANVQIELERSRVEQTEENFDPDTVAVRSEQKQSEIRGEQSGIKSGVPGVQSNTPELTAAIATGPDSSSNANRTLELTNYEVSKTVRKISTPAGSLKRLALAVVVDGTYASEGGVRKYVPRSPEEMARITGLARTAVGFDASRGDTVEVTSAPLHESVPEAAAPAEPRSRVEQIEPYLVPAGAVLVVVLAGVLLALRAARRKKAQKLEIMQAQLAAEEQKALEGGAAQGGLPQGDGAAGIGEGAAIAALPSGSTSPLDPSLELQLEHILKEVGGTDPAETEDATMAAARNQKLESALQELASNHPKAIAAALTTWMNDRNA